MFKVLWTMFLFFISWFTISVVALYLFDSVIIGGIVGFILGLWVASKA